MPTNVTPEYRRAEQLFREAETTEAKITALELMLQTIPKHKGTDHLQADIKRRLSKLRAGPTGKAGARHKDIFHIPKGAAAGQVMLLGVPNSGKSSLVGRLSHAHVHIADFPFSTHGPVPGMMMHEDVPIQLVDMPPILAEHVEPGQVGAYRQCDLIVVVADLSATDVTEEIDLCLEFLEQRQLLAAPDADEDDQVLKRMVRPCFCVCTKSDLASDGDFDVLCDMYGSRWPMMSVSAENADSLRRLAAKVFELLRVVRIYSKLPGKEPEMKDPFILPVGGTVHDLARLVHRDLAEKLRYARGWGVGLHPGQPVPREHVLQDRDVIELHFS